METEQRTEMEKFGRFVKEKRTALGMSIPQLSKIIFNDKNCAFMRSVENGSKKNITIAYMEKILKALNSEIKYNER